MKEYLPLVTILAISIGWFVVDYQATRREKRKEAYQLLELILKAIKENHNTLEPTILARGNIKSNATEHIKLRMDFFTKQRYYIQLIRILRGHFRNSDKLKLNNLQKYHDQAELILITTTTPIKEQNKNISPNIFNDYYKYYYQIQTDLLLLFHDGLLHIWPWQHNKRHI